MKPRATCLLGHNNATPEFRTASGGCRQCNRERARYLYQRNRENVRQQKRGRSGEHEREKSRARTKSYRTRHPERVRERMRAYSQKHHARLTESRRRYIRKRLKDPTVRLARSLRTRLGHAIVQAQGSKSARTLELIGIPPTLLRLWLASRWKPGMHWGNYGPRGWHVDHIRPCATFDLTDPEQQRECFGWRNLQPLWALENLRKGKRAA